ncbi:hypothetical protein NLJ89_g6080 [Agrocybe chaxingu]|uniref:Uncharacterized protein n=1 Tax=Agrocybe chaxingu TaxID=84603 RepID=A0A9W8MUE5_9AGAR|nr:hypothetical protein NLJ89_g6080 [Agrocybe chaxingu]
MGLNGLLFYEIPEGRKDSNRSTFESVMGDLQDTHDLDLLFDTVNGKVFHFPACACTSFLAGQAMHASFINRPDLRPRPSSDGFSVLLSTDARSSAMPTDHERKVGNVQQSFLQLEDFVDEDEERYVAELLKSFSSGDLCPMLALDDADDPHLSLFVRRATLPSSENSPNRRSSSDLNDLYDAKEEGDGSLDTIESLGVVTPPLGSSVDATLCANDVNRYRNRKPSVDADPPSFLDLS